MDSPPTQTPPEGHFASINGIEMYYQLHGEGPLLVLLHGSIGSSLGWKPFIPDLATYFKLVVPDMRGPRTVHQPNEPHHHPPARPR